MYRPSVFLLNTPTNGLEMIFTDNEISTTDLLINSTTNTFPADAAVATAAITPAAVDTTTGASSVVISLPEIESSTDRNRTEISTQSDDILVEIESNIDTADPNPAIIAKVCLSIINAIIIIVSIIIRMPISSGTIVLVFFNQLIRLPSSSVATYSTILHYNRENNDDDDYEDDCLDDCLDD